MTDTPAPTYRFRGSVEPSAEVSRPVAVRKNAASEGDGTKSTSATLDIFDVIDSWGGWWGISAGDVDRALKAAGDVDTLYVRLNSPGGEAQEGVAIANLLRAHKAEVRTTVYGIAASAASVIAIAGDTVSMAPGSILMVHEAWDIAIGNADEMRKTVASLDAVSDGYADLYALKAGGTREEWRGVMRGEKWYPAQDAVAAKLADSVGLDSQLPADLPPVETDDDVDEAVVVNVDVEINPAARAAARRFDLSMFTHAPAALAATQTPAEPPETPPNETKEADAMSDTENKGLRERLGLAEDADEATLLAKVDELLEQATTPDEAAAAALDPKAISAALAAEGKVVVSQIVLDELKEGAKAGVEARGKQLADERDEAIAKAFSEGKISADRRASWTAAWDKDPEGTKADLESLPVRFPVATASTGYLGHDGSAGDTVAFSDDEAGALAAQFGVSKEALLNG